MENKKKKPIKQMSFKELINEHKKLVKDLEGAKNQYHEQKKELNDYLKEYAKLKGYGDGGQVQESQQKQYQAKDYFGKGSNGAGEGVANSMGIAMTMAKGGKVEEALKHPDVLGAGAEKRKHLSPKETVQADMAEFKKGTLRSGSGQHVTDPKQAIAIALSEKRKKQGYRRPQNIRLC